MTLKECADSQGLFCDILDAVHRELERRGLDRVGVHIILAEKGGTQQGGDIRLDVLPTILRESALQAEEKTPSFTRKKPDPAMKMRRF